MLRQRIRLFMLLALIVSAPLVANDANDLQISFLEMPQPRWGDQRISFTVTNPGSWIRYVVVETQVVFTHGGPQRTQRQNYLLLPDEEKDVISVVSMPATYGTAAVSVTLYDVIDTLDYIAPSMQIFSETDTIDFQPSAAARAMLDQPLLFPSRVAKGPLYDTDIARIIVRLLAEDKSVSDIAALLDTEERIVDDVVRMLVRHGQAVRETAGRFSVTFPVVPAELAIAGFEFAERYGDSLVAAILADWEQFPAYRDSLIAAGSLSADRNDFLGGGAALHRSFPLIGALLLWSHLGHRFVVDGRDLDMYPMSDPCHAEARQFMYGVVGDSNVVSNIFYYLTGVGGQHEIYYKTTEMAMNCPDELVPGQRLPRGRGWRVGEDESVTIVLMDPGLVGPALERLGTQARPLVDRLASAVTPVLADHNVTDLSTALRFWLWGLIAERVTDQLITREVLPSDEDVAYKLVSRGGN